MTGLFTVIGLSLCAAATPDTLAPRAFDPLPLGAVMPRGWLLDQLRIQADGLSGHLDEFWADIRDSGWIGGSAEGWERGPYWLDGVVPLAYQLNDEELKAKVVRWMDYIITHQREDGWLGPESSKGYKAHDPWPTFVTLKAMTQYYEATGDERVLAAMKKNFEYMRKLLDKQPLFEWGKFRWMDLVLSIHWLYDRQPDPALLKLAKMAREQGFDWTAHFADFKYTERVTKDFSLATHVVNNAMSVKAAPVWWRQSNDEADRAAIARTFEMLDRYHGQVTGIFGGDEHYAGPSPSQGSELCSVVEYMFSLEQAIAILGSPAFADRLERIAYNALPGTFSPDMWAHQYDQHANQVVCRVSEDRVYATNGPNANLYGLEPNYGCCTANMHQGWPKLTSHLWMKAPGGKLAAIAYAPCAVAADIDGKPVAITVDTDYPFNDTINVAVTADTTCTLLFRIPGWAEGAQITVGSDAPVNAQPGVFHEVRRNWKGVTPITLRFPMKPRIERRFHNSAAILRGPLVFSLKIGEYWKKVAGEEPHADWEVYPTTPWNYGIVIDEANPESAVTFETGPVTKQPFAPDTAPVRASVKGRIVPEWVLEHSAAGPLPASPVKSTQPEATLTLIPYGAAKLRVSEFPVLEP